MKVAFAALGILLIVIVPLAGCSHSMTAPDPSASALTSGTARLWGMVIEESGVCIPGATVAVVVGQTASGAQVQDTPCDIWGYSGGFVLKGLAADVSITLRVSAPGYQTKDVSAVPTLSQSTVFEVVLAKSQ
jgi:hypothetical protein